MPLPAVVIDDNPGAAEVLGCLAGTVVGLAAAAVWVYGIVALVHDLF